MAIMLVLVAPASAHKAHLRTIYSFCSLGNCADGKEPSAGLVADGAGNLYGTALFGGDGGVGTVFQLAPNARRTKWKYKRLYSFCALSNCSDGSDPEAALVIDTSGALYGVTMAGGANDGGVAYKLMPNAKHTKWVYSVLYSFCAQTDCADGREPQARLAYAGQEAGTPYDGSSLLYGTASQAGVNKQGVAFALTPGAHWNEQVLYNFCSQDACADGADPVSALTVGPSGDLFGTTYAGGNNNDGVAFRLNVGDGNRRSVAETILHSFCSSANCADGAFPAAAMHFDASGNLLGTTFGGGTKSKNCTDIGVGGCGTIFKLTPSDDTWQESVLHDFCAKKNCTDGGYPLAGILVGPSNVLFGASLYGGGGAAPGSGTVFGATDSEKALYRFCTDGDCIDGAGPEGDLIMDASGNIYGTNIFSGANNGGTVFELIP